MHPERVGPYLIDRKIGAGGMGTVYLAHHAETGRTVALKVLLASMAKEEGFVARFTREVEAMQQLTNPHVVEVFDSGMDDNGVYYYAMEYVEGETLTQRLRRDRRIPWREVIDVSVQICSALKAAHDAGIIHRDLKPSNLLIAQDGTIKLTDFGVAQVFAAGKLTMTGGVIGTAEYMSPEQAGGQRATKKSDLYSLGAVMYVMLTGRPPFTGKTTLEVIQKHKFAQFDRASLYATDMPYWLDDVVTQLLDKAPDKRIPDAYVLSRRLQEIVKKVELSQQEETRAANKVVSSDALTVAAGGTVPASTGPGPEVHDRGGPGEGTLMRDLVRAEVERIQQPGMIGRWLNNIWVLIALLALVIVGGVLWFQDPPATDEELFASGEALMERPAGSAWEQARDEYFLPLLERDEATWEERVEPYLERIAMHEFTTQLTSDRRPVRGRVKPQSDPQRFLQLAVSARQMGDLARAERLLASLHALLQDDPAQEELLALVDQLREEIRLQQEQQGEGPGWLESIMQRGDAAAQAGQINEAKSLWQAVIELYGTDPRDSVAVQVEVARRNLENARETRESSASPADEKQTTP